jgi:formylglycine-generating enzyme required for sulfatase activity
MVLATGAGRGVERARGITDRLFAQLRPDAYLERPIPERHRLLFYLGHLEAFDWNQVARASLGLPPVSQALDDLFAFGIDPPPGELPSDRPEDWPSLDETLRYVREVRARFDEVVARAPEEVVCMAVEHRLMHAETFSYLLHNLDCERRVPVALPEDIVAPPPEARWVGIPEGLAALGRARGTGFGWDNEFGECSERVPAFAMSRYKVTNGDYLAFLEAGGPVPFYWSRRDGEWRYRAMRGERKLPLDWPVYVNHDQATAYAAWRGRRLPSEAQFQRAAFGTPDGADADPRPYPWGVDAPTPARGNFDFGRADPVPVTANPAGDSGFGVAQLVGNGWEWTRSIFAPFPGFEAHPAYPGYSANFFDGGHYVMKGASPVTDRALLRPTFRNWFRPHYPYVYATFRLVEE